MIFIELVLEKFGPYYEPQVINLRPQKEDIECPIILFGGMNGGGKTTLMDAMRLALYGSRAQCSTRGNLSYNDFLIQCLNREIEENEKAQIQLTIEHLQDDKPVILKIVRRWDKELKEGKDNLSILIKGKYNNDDWWPDQVLVNTWDEYIENILPLGISSLFLFDGEQVKELAEMETPPEFVIDAIKSLLGLELAERLAQDLEILISRKRKEMASEKQIDDLQEIEKNLEKLSQELGETKDEFAELTIQLESVHKAQRQARENFISDGGNFARDRTVLTKKLDELMIKAEGQREELRKLAADVLPLTLIMPILNDAQQQGAKEINQEKAKMTRDLLKERSDRLLNYLKQLELKPTHIDQIQNFLITEDQELDRQANQDEQPWLNSDAKTLNLLEYDLKFKVNNAQIQAKQKLEDIQTIESDMEDVERQIAHAASPELYEKLEQELAQFQDQIVKIKSAQEAVKQREIEIQRKLSKTYKELEEYADTYLVQKNYQHFVNSCTKVQETLQRFKHKLTLSKLNKLETEITHCFRYLLHKTELVNRVTIDTDLFSLSLYDPDGKPVSKQRLSAGEKQLLAIAFLWGLARVSGKHLPVAIDTPLGRLDSSHRQNLVERYFPSASHQVILLSTDTEITEFEVEKLREMEAIAQEYLLEYDPHTRQTIVKPGYFW